LLINDLSSVAQIIYPFVPHLSIHLRQIFDFFDSLSLLIDFNSASISWSKPFGTILASKFTLCFLAIAMPPTNIGIEEKADHIFLLDFYQLDISSSDIDIDALPSPQTTLSFGQLEQLAGSSYDKGKYSQTVILPIIREFCINAQRRRHQRSAYYFKKALIQPDHIGANSTKI
jgi:hypothetical protein